MQYAIAKYDAKSRYSFPNNFTSGQDFVPYGSTVKLFNDKREAAEYAYTLFGVDPKIQIVEYRQPVRYAFKAGERLKSDYALRYVDRLEKDINGFMSATCRELDVLIVPADKAEAVAKALNSLLGGCDVPFSYLVRKQEA